MDHTAIFDTAIDFLNAVVIAVPIGLLITWIGLPYFSPGTPAPPRRLLVWVLALLATAFVLNLSLRIVRSKIDIPQVQLIAQTLPTTQSMQTALQAGPTVTPMSKSNEVARDDFGSPSSGWNTINDWCGSSGYDSGKYFIDLSAPCTFATLWKHAGPAIDNAVMEVDILGPLHSPGTTQGFAFGWHNDWKGTYAFTVDGSGVCKVLEATSDKEWALADSGKLSQFGATGAYHTLRAVIRNFELRAYVDGELCITHLVPGYRQGYVGLVASPNTQTHRDRFLFDEFRIYEIP